MAKDIYALDVNYENTSPTPEFYEELRKTLIKQTKTYGGPVIQLGKSTDTYFFDEIHKRKANKTLRQVCANHGLEVQIRKGKAKITISQQHQNP